MKPMTTHERMTRMYAHREADRIPVMDGPWSATLERWTREGMPKGADYVEYFDLDRISYIGADNSPRYPVRTIEETENHKIYTSLWGVTMKQWKHAASTPEFLDFTIVDRDSWAKAKARMTPTSDRINWEHIKNTYAARRKRGDWIAASFWFGFDVTHSWMVGTERLLTALADDPEWCMDMFSTHLEMHLALFEQVWQAGYTFDEINWPDDMGYKGTPFFSTAMYRELLKPFHRKAVEWAHAHGIKARLHSCGNINPLIPDLLDIGLDGLNPLEVKAGMDPVALKGKIGDRVLLHGGVNAVLWDNLPAIEAEMQRVIPAMKQNGGYIFSSDHSVPSSVSLEGFRQITTRAKELGSYT
jgi:uroporphyrinogen decarboxylase